MAQKADLRRLGTILFVGALAGFGARYVADRAARTSSGRPPRLVDWDQARDIAVQMAQSEPLTADERLFRQQQYQQMVARSEPLLAEYMNVRLPEPISRISVMDRREWLLANVRSFEPVFKPIEDLYLEQAKLRNATGSVLSELNSKAMGVQMGIMLGVLARRVLGQYDLSLLSPEPQARGVLYFVEQNIANVQKQLGLNDEDFRLWITLHECTHVFQFEAFPWVRGYFQELVSQFIGQMPQQLGGMSEQLGRMLEQILRGERGQGHWIERMLTGEQREVFDKLQALMSVVEGYSNHTMDAIGAKLLPSFQQIEERVAQRQQNQPLWQIIFNRVTGMELKLAQYKQGEAFVNAVVGARGITFANRVWERADNLPTMAEIRDPMSWVARIERG